MVSKKNSCMANVVDACQTKSLFQFMFKPQNAINTSDLISNDFTIKRTNESMSFPVLKFIH